MRRHELNDLARHRGTEWGNSGRVAESRRHDHIAGRPVSVVCCYSKALVVEPFYDSDSSTGLHRCFERLGVTLQMPDELGHRHEVVGMLAVVLEMR